MRADLLLIEDHQRLRDLLAQLADSSSDKAEQRSQLLDQLLQVLDVHVQLEDELFYPAIREVSPLFGIAHAEHRQIDDQLAVVFRTDAGGDEFPVEVAMLAATLEHHANEEETDMFPQARSALGDTVLEALGERMRHRQNELRQSRGSRARLRVKRTVLRRL